MKIKELTEYWQKQDTSAIILLHKGKRIEINKLSYNYIIGATVHGDENYDLSDCEIPKTPYDELKEQFEDITIQSPELRQFIRDYLDKYKELLNKVE